MLLLWNSVSGYKIEIDLMVTENNLDPEMENVGLVKRLSLATCPWGGQRWALLLYSICLPLYPEEWKEDE